MLSYDKDGRPVIPDGNGNSSEAEEDEERAGDEARKPLDRHKGSHVRSEREWHVKHGCSLQRKG